MSPFTAVASQERNPTFLLSLKGSLTPLRYQLKTFPDIPSPQGREHHASRDDSRRAPGFPIISRCESISLLHWERNLGVPLAPPREDGLSFTLDRNARGSCHHSKRHPVLGASMGGPTLDKVMWRDLKGKGESGLKGSSS